MNSSSSAGAADSCALQYHDEDDDDEYDDLDDDFSPYVDGKGKPVPWVETLTAMLIVRYGAGTVYVLLHTDFEEVGVVSALHMHQMMYPPNPNAGSYGRYVVRFTCDTTTVHYFFVKEVDPEYGPNEVVIGDAFSHMDIPEVLSIHSLFGFEAQSFRNAGPISYYVVLPWVNSMDFPTFVSQNMPKKIGLTTKQILKEMYLLVSGMVRMWREARFIHCDAQKSQILVLPPFSLRLIDFGHAQIDVTIESTRYKVAVHRRGTRDFREDLQYMLRFIMHPVFNNNRAGRDDKLVKAWGAQTRLYGNSKSKNSEDQLLSWLEENSQ